MPKTLFVAALAALALVSSAATAADYQPYSATAQPGRNGWQGPYVGANLGYQWSSVTRSSAGPSGVAGGVLVGHNWQYGQFVVGGETDLQITGADDTFAPWKFSNPWFGTLRARAGVAVNNMLFYGTVGLAYGTLKAENVGTEADPWPPVQIDAYKRGVAAILKQINAPNESWCCGHKEFAPKRKIDPSFDMDAFRLGVKAISIGNAPAPAPIPHTDEQNRPTLRRGSTGEAVKTVQTKVGATASGVFDGDTEAKVRILQRQNNLVPDGIVGPKTWAAITP